MSKPALMQVNYLDLEIKSDALRNYDKCDQETQSIAVECTDIATEACLPSLTPPIRPPPLRIKTMDSLEHESLSVGSSSAKSGKGSSLRDRIKGMRNGSAKVTKEMCSKMVNALKTNMPKSKSKTRSQKTALQKATTLPTSSAKNNDEIKIVNSNPVTQSPKPVLKKEFSVRQESLKESIKPLNCVSLTEVITGSSVLSSYPIMTMITDYVNGDSVNAEEENMDELFEHWITNFVDTCQRQIKNVIISTNQHLSQYFDLNCTTLIATQRTGVKAQTIPTWSQVRILEDSTNQKYIALKKSHSMSWFVLPRECPKLSQRWVCYPIITMNTFENELKVAEENSIQWLLLRMIMLKCFNKVVKNDVVPVKYDMKNILLVSSSCGLIVVFRESQEELQIESFPILKVESLADVPSQWSIAKNEVRDALLKFFYRLDIISVLISSIWPLDFLAYLLAKSIMESDN